MNYNSTDNELFRQLSEINNKYETCTFIDINFIELFGLKKKSDAHTNINLDRIKKKIITRYYSLA